RRRGAAQAPRGGQDRAARERVVVGQRRRRGVRGGRAGAVDEDERAAAPAAREVGGQRGLQGGELPRRLAADQHGDVDLVEEVVDGARAARRRRAGELVLRGRGRGR